MSKKNAPKGLSQDSQRFWADVTSNYDLRYDELRVLEDACREMDLIARLEKETIESPTVVRGSQGQPVAAPQISELRQHRAVLMRLLKQLNLPDADGGDAAANERSAKARAAAVARWKRGA